MTVNNHSMSIQKDNIGNLNHPTNSHGLRKIATHLYNYPFRFLLAIVYICNDI